MKKMSRRIFVNMFFISILVILLSTFLTAGIVYRSYAKQNIESIRNELSAAANGVNLNGAAYLKSLKSEHRVTLIGRDGTVLYDNQNNTREMENHNKRKEVIEARQNGEGYSERYSNTISQKAVNIAVLLDNGNVLRISQTTSTMWNIMLHAFMPMLSVMILAAVFVTYLSYRVSRAITRPINAINLSAPDQSSVYEEIKPLVERIHQQNNQIEENLKKLNEEHERQDHMRRDFTANVSHELKTPLTSISGFAEIIKNGMVEKEEDIRRFAGKIYDESQRLIILVGDIIKLSQLDGKDVMVTMEPIDLYETSRAVMSHLEAAAKKKNVQLDLRGSHIVITGVEQIIEEMIFNLIDNGIKYNREGGKVTVTVKKNNNGIVLSVSDTGIGIPREDIDRIFERFYRVDKSHSKEIGGTGLGLSIVKHGAIFHNAAILVKSKAGKGSTFDIVF